MLALSSAVHSTWLVVAGGPTIVSTAPRLAARCAYKILDCVGDLYLAGAPLIGRFSGTRSGHALHYKLLCALFAEDAAWTTVSMERRASFATPAWEAEAIAATA